MSQSLSSRAMSFDTAVTRRLDEKVQSQSLSSRAMSFDEVMKTNEQWVKVSIPFEQGNVFRRPLTL